MGIPLKREGRNASIVRVNNEVYRHRIRQLLHAQEDLQRIRVVQLERRNAMRIRHRRGAVPVAPALTVAHHRHGPTGDEAEFGDSGDDGQSSIDIEERFGNLYRILREDSLRNNLSQTDLQECHD